MRFAREIAIVAGMAITSPALSQIVPRDPVAFAALFAGVAADKERAASLVPLWFGPVAEDRTGLYAGLIVRLLRDPAFAAYALAADGWTIFPPGVDPDAYAVGQAAYAAAQAAIDGGVTRLAAVDQRAYLATGTEFAAWVAENHPASCRHIMTENEPGDPETMTLQAEYQNALPPEAVFAYLDLGYRAIRAEIEDTPPAEPFTNVQLELGYDAYTEALEAAVLARTDAEALVAAANLEPTATDADICEVMLLTLTIVHELLAPQRDWAVQVILTRQ